MKEKHQKKYNNGKKSRPKLANKQTKKTKTKKREKKRFFLINDRRGKVYA